MNEKQRHAETVNYELQLRETESGIGYFSCFPADDPDMETCIAHIRACPNDEFMRRHLMGMLSARDADFMAQQIKKTDPADKILLSLFCDTCLLYEKFKDLRKYFPKSVLSDLSRHSPLIYLKSAQDKDRELHRKWIQVFADNILNHRPIRPPDQIGLAPLFAREELSALPQETVSITQVREKLAQKPCPDNSPPRPEAKETIRRAMNRLARIRILAGEEMRHEASLSPIALLRKWKMNVSVQNGRHSYALSGIQTSYGRGLDLEPARAAYLMEIIERYASFASFEDDGAVGYEKPYPLIFGTYSSLKEKGFQVLNPNDLALEAPYGEEPLYWMEGEAVSEKGYVPILIPAQCVFLFCNLDEAKLFSGLGSTGLASGNTLAEAKVSALMEVIERHCEGVTPFNPAQCFDMETSDPRLSKLLNLYAEAGIRVRFQV
ncbi:MAG: YcaO-like family protein [Desulfobacterales bacterium]